jgi:hypothetical protein
MPEFVVLTGGREVVEGNFWHLDYSTFKKHSYKSNSTCQRYYVSLGSSFGEWHKTTRARKLHLYNYVLDHSAEFLSALNQNWNSRRHAELLVGNLARLVASRIARAEAQIARLPEDVQLSDNEVKIPSHSESPRSLSQAYSHFVQGGFDQAIEAQCLRDRFGERLNVSLISEEVSLAGNEVGTVSVKAKLYSGLGARLRRLSRRNSIFIISSYLGRASEFLLNLQLFQTPVLSEIRAIRLDVQHERPTNNLLSYFPAESSKTLALEITKALVPQFYFLTAAEQEKRFSQLGWPRSPKLVFTSNSFGFDDEFIVFLANRIPMVTYIVGQHGNNYGVSALSEPVPEMATSDQFLSWGWLGRNVEPFGVIKPKLKSRRKPSNILVITRDEIRSDMAVDVQLLNETYIDKVSDLIEELANRGQRVVVKLHSSHWPSLESRIQALVQAHPQRVSISQSDSLRSLLGKGFLPIFTYDSTGMLEIGTSGGHFLLFTADGLDHVLDNFAPNYEFLAEGELLGDEPVQFSNWIQRRLKQGFDSNDDLAVINFLRGIAFAPKSRVRGLAKILRTHSKRFSTLSESSSKEFKS